MRGPDPPSIEKSFIRQSDGLPGQTGRGERVQTARGESSILRVNTSAIRRTGQPGSIHTNTVEGYYSMFKRGMKGVYQHCSEKHLHRYLSEFVSGTATACGLATRTQMRADKGIMGKQLTYRRPHAA
jgi:hypothetical protein